MAVKLLFSPGGPNGESGYILGTLRICRKSSRPTNADATDCRSLSKHETAVRSCLQLAQQPGRIWLFNASQDMSLRSPSKDTLSTGAFSTREIAHSRNDNRQPIDCQGLASVSGSEFGVNSSSESTLLVRSRRLDFRVCQMPGNPSENFLEERNDSACQAQWHRDNHKQEAQFHKLLEDPREIGDPISEYAHQ